MRCIKHDVEYAYWLSGEWTGLLQLDICDGVDTAEKKYIKLLLFAATLQVMEGNCDEELAMAAVQEEITQLKSLGLSKEEIGSILISGSYNSLARAYCLSYRPDKARAYFHRAIEAYHGGDCPVSILNMRAEFQELQLRENGVKLEKNKSLKQLYKEHDGHASDKWSLYLDVYNELLSRFRGDSVSLLEIGVQNGGSLEIWSKFFPFYNKIIGCDINPKCIDINYKYPDLYVVIGDAANDSVKKSIIDIQDRFDIIIDDGSHKSSDIVKAFFNYFPLLKDGGVFIAEDLHCSYWRRYEGGLGYEKSSMEFFKLLSDSLNHEHWAEEKMRTDILHNFPFFDKKIEKVLGDIHSVEFFNSLCVVTRKKESKNLLQRRVVAGVEQVVVNIKNVDGTYSKAMK